MDCNVDPTIQHSLGCQIVSMNLHSSNERLLVNDGRFRANGSTGYVLKPAHLIDGNKAIEREQQWKISLLCGSCLPKADSWSLKKNSVGALSAALVDPFVRVTLFQGDSRGATMIHSTLPAKNNGLNPIWDREEDTFVVAVSKPSVAIVLLSVWDDKTKDFIAGAALPLSCFREGYRNVALFDSMHTRCGPFAFASLFIKAQKLT
jgi:phosphatidylinositol phospholipase C delta